jgi:plastocyanin
MRTVWALIVAVPLGLAACGGGTPEEPRVTADAPEPAAEAPAAVGPEGGGIIEATVTYDGPPVVQTVRVNKDPEQCGTEARLERVAVGPGGGLAHAVVSVTGPTGDGPQLEKGVMDQRGCVFLPRVVATQTGEFDFLNNDGILHNVRTSSTVNPPINKAMPRFRTSMTEQFDRPEVFKVTCDVHSWMEGWVAVFDHPYFGVTDESGTVRIANVPPGTHTIELWHEELGTRTEEVEVREGEVTAVAFELTQS